jgi:predicted Zn-dependent peptidase
MTHAYEGRLGRELINRRGLIYYIGSSYNSDGSASWISITMGVNPENLKSCREIFNEMMQDLRKNPPTDAEVAEAKQHLIGRRISANESNSELSAFYTREWIEQGRLMSLQEFEKKVHAVTSEQVRKIIPAFLNGGEVIVDTAP